MTWKLVELNLQLQFLVEDFVIYHNIVQGEHHFLVVIYKYTKMIL